MKNAKNLFFKIIFGALFCVTFSMSSAFAEDMMNFDYDFIDNAFTNPNPTTKKQFEEVMSNIENHEPQGIFYKLKRFMNRNNPEYDKALKKQYEAPNKQPLRIKDTPDDKPTVILGSDFYDSNNRLLLAGHYQVDYKKDSTGGAVKYFITLLQGKTRVGEIKAIPYEDDWETPAVVYSRSVNVREDLVRIIYSNLDLTLQGYVRLKR